MRRISTGAATCGFAVAAVLLVASAVVSEWSAQRLIAADSSGTMRQQLLPARATNALGVLLGVSAVGLAYLAFRGRLAEHQSLQDRLNDIDNRKQAERTLRDADRHKNEFLAVLAHELRNPLTPLPSALEVLRMQSNQNSEIRWATELIAEQTSQMVRLVEDLLDVARISHGKLKLKRQTVRLSDVVSHAVGAARPLLDARGQRLELFLPDVPVWLEADDARLVQVLENLLNNAVKYTHEGGRIQLIVEADGAYASIRVRDNGVGIPRELLPRVFDLFAQTDELPERTQSGLGIGLKLVARLVEMHGGSATASSEGPGCGSEFVVRLPMLPEDAVPTEPAPIDDDLEERTTRRILLVDDERNIVDALARVLEKKGHDVRTAANGQQALQAAHDSAPDVAVIDIGLPGMDGCELARHLRRLPEGERTVLVALTGYSHHEVRRETSAAGFEHCLVKPLDLADLDAILQSGGVPSGKGFQRQAANNDTSPA